MASATSIERKTKHGTKEEQDHRRDGICGRAPHPGRKRRGDMRRQRNRGGHAKHRRPAANENRTRTKTAGDEETEPATSTEDDPCADLAPKALGVYMGGERGQLEGEYFTPDAAGLDIPASSIAPQPLPETEFTGFPCPRGGGWRHAPYPPGWRHPGCLTTRSLTTAGDARRSRAHWKADTGCMKANQRNKSDEGKRTGSASPHQRRGRRGIMGSTGRRVS